MWDSCVNKQLLLENGLSSPAYVWGVLLLEITKCLWIEKTFLCGFFCLEI